MSATAGLKTTKLSKPHTCLAEVYASPGPFILIWGQLQTNLPPQCLRIKLYKGARSKIGHDFNHSNDFLNFTTTLFFFLSFYDFGQKSGTLIWPMLYNVHVRTRTGIYPLVLSPLSVLSLNGSLDNGADTDDLYQILQYTIVDSGRKSENEVFCSSIKWLS